MTGAQFKALANKIPDGAEVVFFSDGEFEPELSQEDGVVYIEEGEIIELIEEDEDEDDDEE